MVQRTVTIFTDDLTDTEGEDIATHTFSLDGVGYEIDLNPDSHQLLLDALAPFLKVGRKSGSASHRRSNVSELMARTPSRYGSGPRAKALRSVPAVVYRAASSRSTKLLTDHKLLIR